MINVWGDSTVTGIVAHLSRREVAEMERKGVPDLDELHIPGHAPMHLDKKNDHHKLEHSELPHDNKVYPITNTNTNTEHNHNQYNIYPIFDDRGSQYQVKF